jgi:hypothetical protein
MSAGLELPSGSQGRAHDRKCAVRIRTRLLVEAGDPPQPAVWLLGDIAREIHRCCGVSLLKAQRLARDWTVNEAVAAFHEMCEVDKLGARGLTLRSWLEWEAGRRPNADYQDLLCRLFTTGPVQLGFATDYSEPAQERSEQEGRGTDRRDVLKHMGVTAAAPAVGGTLAEAAAEALAFTRRAQTSAVGPGALEHLELAVTQFSRTYAGTSPAALFPQVWWYRREVDRLLDGPHTLREGRELYVWGGWLSVLLSGLAFDQGDLATARAYAVDAWHHGEQAGHHELCAWAMVEDTLSALHNHQPDQALTAALRGAQVAPAGHPVVAWLVGRAVRAYAVLGQREGFEAACRDAMDLRERLPAQASTGLGTESGKPAVYVITSNLASGCIALDIRGQAQRHASDALDLITALSEPDRRPSAEAYARIDLALALVPLGSPDEACALGHQALSSERVGFSERLNALELDTALQRDYADLPVVVEFHERCRLLT